MEGVFRDTQLRWSPCNPFRSLSPNRINGRADLRCMQVIPIEMPGLKTSRYRNCLVSLVNIESGTPNDSVECRGPRVSAPSRSVPVSPGPSRFGWGPRLGTRPDSPRPHKLSGRPVVGLELAENLGVESAHQQRHISRYVPSPSGSPSPCPVFFPTWPLPYNESGYDGFPVQMVTHQMTSRV